MLLFWFSYMFLILPATWASDLEHVDDGIERPISHIYADISQEAFRAEDTFIVDNGNGTFSLYVNGHHVWDTDDSSQELFSFLPMRARGE